LKHAEAESQLYSWVCFVLNVQLCFDLIEEWILNNPQASICTPEGVNEFRDIAIFQDYHGLPEFRNVWNTFHLSLSLSLQYYQIE
jgi:hypothetical protein